MTLYNTNIIVILSLICFTGLSHTMDTIKQNTDNARIWIEHFLMQPNDGVSISNQELAKQLIALSTATSSDVSDLALRAALHQIIPHHLHSKILKLIAINSERFISIGATRYELLGEIAEQDSCITGNDGTVIPLFLTRVTTAPDKQIENTYFICQQLSNNIIQVYNNDTQKSTPLLLGQHASIRAMHLDNFGNNLLTVDEDNKVILWRLSNFDTIQGTILGSQQEVEWIGFGHSSTTDYACIIYTHGAGIHLFPLDFKAITLGKLGDVIETYYPITHS